jgi:hypothetical protein
VHQNHPTINLVSASQLNVTPLYTNYETRPTEVEYLPQRQVTQKVYLQSPVAVREPVSVIDNYTNYTSYSP